MDEWLLALFVGVFWVPGMALVLHHDREIDRRERDWSSGHDDWPLVA